MTTPQKLALDALEKINMALHDPHYAIDQSDFDIIRDALRQPAHTVGDDAGKTVGDLLAIIHRDGGHYTMEHGFEKSFNDAVLKVLSSFDSTENPQPTAEVAAAVEYAEGIADEHEVKAKRMAAEGYEKQYLDCRLDQAKHLRTLIAAAKENQSLERQIKMASDWSVKQGRSLVEYAEEVSALKQAAQSPQRSAELVRALKFYADIGNYARYYGEDAKPVERDGGSLATQALSAFGEDV